MAPLDFLAVVLPSSGNGHYCVAELSSRKREHVFMGSIEALSPTIERFNKRKLDTYFALATFADPEAGRKAANAQCMRALFVDIDCNHKGDLPDASGNIKPKAYPSAKAAVEALATFLDATGLSALGNPWLVSSGGGVHAYWPLREDVPIDTWLPVAENLKSLCAQHKLGIDHTVTADASRVLRMPGTTNTGVKAGKPVRKPAECKLVSEGAIFDLARVAEIVRGQLVGKTFEAKRGSAPSLAIAGTRPTRGAAPQEAPGFKIVNDVQTSFKRIFARTVEGTGCAQLAYYVEHAADDGMEPLWRGMLSLAKCCEQDGEKYARRLSDLHPYDRERMQAKMAEIKGPYSCAKLDSENPGVCDGCPHQGRITNPLALGRVVPEDTAEKEVELRPLKPPPGLDIPRKGEAAAADDDDEDEPRHQFKRPEAPFGFGYAKGGGVFAKRLVDGADGEQQVKEVRILPYDFFVLRQLKTLESNGHFLQFYYDHPSGGQRIMLPQRAAVSKEETIKALAEQNIIALSGPGNDKNLFEYVRACAVDVSAAKVDPLVMPDHCGWQTDGSYVHGGYLYRANKKPMEIPMVGLENLNDAMSASGTFKQWRRFMDMLVAKGLYDLLTIVLISAGAPLMRFTGISGLTYHFTSRNSGTGKSLGLDAAASVWGIPSRFRVSRDTSAVAMQQRLGLLHSEPLITDEITQKNRNADMEWLPSFLFDMAEGKGKERMEASTNKERRNTTYWCTVAMLTSNNPAVDYLTGTRAHSSEGELRRLLELIMETQLSWSADEVALVKSLQHNCGHLGPMLVQYMVDNMEEVHRLTAEMVDAMYVQLNATNDERFWMAGIGAAMTAGVLLGKDHTDLLPLPLNHILRVFKRMLTGMREHTRQGHRDATDILNMFVRENYGSFVSIKYVNRRPTLGTEGMLADDKSLARARVMGRVERGVKEGFVDLYIEERVMRAFCATKSFGYTDFKRQIEQRYPTRYLKKNLTAKTQGPELRVYAICITQPDTDFEPPEGEDAPVE